MTNLPLLSLIKPQFELHPQLESLPIRGAAVGRSRLSHAVQVSPEEFRALGLPRLLYLDRQYRFLSRQPVRPGVPQQLQSAWRPERRFESRGPFGQDLGAGILHAPPGRAFDGHYLSRIKDRVGERNSPTFLNALYNKTQFWDRGAPTLEEQALFRSLIRSRPGNPGSKLRVQ